MPFGAQKVEISTNHGCIGSFMYKSSMGASRAYIFWVRVRELEIRGGIDFQLTSDITLSLLFSRSLRTHPSPSVAVNVAVITKIWWP